VSIVGTDGGGIVRLAPEVGAPLPLHAVHSVAGIGRNPVASVRVSDDVRNASFLDGVGEFLLGAEDIQSLGGAYEYGVVMHIEPLDGASLVRQLMIQVELLAIISEYLVRCGGIQMFRKEFGSYVLLYNRGKQPFLHVVGGDASVGHDVDMPFLVSRDVIDVVVEYAVGIVFLFLVDLEVFSVVEADPVACTKPHESPLVLIDGND